MNEELYELLNRLSHRLVRVIGEIVKEKESYTSKMQKHIEDLALAQQEALQLAEKINNKGG